MRISDQSHDAYPLSVHGLIHARSYYQGEPDARSDPRRRQPFKEAGSRQTGEVTEIAASASAREARAGLTKTMICKETRQACLLTPVPARHTIGTCLTTPVPKRLMGTDTKKELLLRATTLCLISSMSNNICPNRHNRYAPSGPVPEGALCSYPDLSP